MNRPLKVIVQRSKWFRGKDDSALLRKADGLMCCLGFACLGAKYTKKEIKDHASPCELEMPIKPPLKALISLAGFNSRKCRKLMDCNDSAIMTDKIREKCLRQLGKRANLAFTFVD